MAHILIAIFLFSAAALQGQRVLAITAARMIDGRGGPPVADAVVVVRGDRIEAAGPRSRVTIPPGAERIDLGDQTILPGLIDAHAHLTIRPDVRGITGQLEGMAEHDARQALRGARDIRVQLLSGVTTLYVVGEMHSNDIHLQDAVARGLTAGPRIFAAGEFITTTAGHGPDASRVTNGPWAMRTLVRKNAEAGASHVKLTITDRMRAGPRAGSMLAPGESNFTREEIEAVAQEAHRLGLKATAHANGPSIKLALEAGIDSIQHGNDLTDELIELFVKYKKGFVSTYTITYQWFFNEWAFLDNEAKTIAEWNGRGRDLITRVRRENAEREQIAQTRKRDLLKAHRRGVPIAVGTDSMHGYLPLEMEWLVEAGFTPLEAVTAATGMAARVLELPDVGVIEPGRLADIIAVAGDPGANIRDVTRVKFIMVGGRRFDELSFR